MPGSVWVITLSLMTARILPDVWAVVWEDTRRLAYVARLGADGARVQTQVSDRKACVFSSGSGYRGSKTRIKF